MAAGDVIDPSSLLSDSTDFEYNPRGLFDLVPDIFNNDTDDADAALATDVATYDNDDIALMSAVTDGIAEGSLSIKMFAQTQGSYFSGKSTSCSVGPKATSSAINSVKTVSCAVDSSSFVDVIRICEIGDSLTPLFEKDSSFSLTLSNIQCFWDVKRVLNSGSNVTTYTNYSGHGWGQLLAFDALGNSEVVECDSISFKWSGKYFSVFIDTCNLPFDVYQIDILYYTDLVESFGIPSNAVDPDFSGIEGNTSVSYINYHSIGFYNSVLTITEHDSVDGFLGNIVSTVNNIKDSIINLPATIWEFISDGLYSLFVPTDEQLADWQDSFDSFCAEHFGFAYEALSIITDIYSSLFDNTDSSGVIVFPEFTLDLLDGNSFSFGGWEVSLIPSGFEYIVSDYLKLITSILITLWFVNMAYNYFGKIFHS